MKRVALTFDIEFDVNHALAPPFVSQPRGAETIDAQVGGVSLGLTRVLETLENYDIRATFFVEALQTIWFGDEEMGRIAERIAAAGHEVQLHVHPVWLLFRSSDWQQQSRKKPESSVHDSLASLSFDEAGEAIEIALAAFRRWKVPEPTAIRTGGLMLERGLYQVFSACGLHISSSLGLAIHRPSDAELHRYSAPLEIGDVLEIPVTSFLGMDAALRRRARLATLIGMGGAEMSDLFYKADQGEIDELVLLSHMSEFFRVDRQDGSIKRNHLVEERLQFFCEAMREREQVECCTINEMAVDFRSRPQSAGHRRSKDQPICVDRVKSLGRFAERLMAPRTAR